LAILLTGFLVCANLTPQTKENTVDPKDSRGRWGFVLASWLDHPNVDASALAVLAALATYADPSGLCWPHPKTIAEKLKKSRPWVLGVLNRLVDAGLIERRPRRSHARSGAWEFVLVGFASSLSATSSDALCQPVNSPGQQADTEQDHQIPESSLENAESQFSQNAGEGKGEMVDPTWVPTAADMAFAAVRRPDLSPSDIALMTEKMLAHHCSRCLPNISGVWRRWLLTERTTDGRRDRDAHRPSWDRRHTDAGAYPGEDALAARNDAAARAALDRILGRRTNGAPAGCA